MPSKCRVDDGQPLVADLDAIESLTIVALRPSSCEVDQQIPCRSRSRLVEFGTRKVGDALLGVF